MATKWVGGCGEGRTPSKGFGPSVPNSPSPWLHHPTPLGVFESFLLDPKPPGLPWPWSGPKRCPGWGAATCVPNWVPLCCLHLHLAWSWASWPRGWAAAPTPSTTLPCPKCLGMPHARVCPWGIPLPHNLVGPLRGPRGCHVAVGARWHGPTMPPTPGLWPGCGWGGRGPRGAHDHQCHVSPWCHVDLWGSLVPRGTSWAGCLAGLPWLSGPPAAEPPLQLTITPSPGGQMGLKNGGWALPNMLGLPPWGCPLVSSHASTSMGRSGGSAAGSHECLPGVVTQGTWGE